MSTLLVARKHGERERRTLKKDTRTNKKRENERTSCR
jgi:hypothetical protein